MLDEAKLGSIAEVIDAHWPDRIAPEDLLNPELWARIERARAALLERLDLSELR
jgi:succinylarginine dihydrolase